VGYTSSEIVESGNIRQDMFQRLITADLVIADISIHNANVFYELGIRHALRDKKTFLIRTKFDEVPFDLKTDRYLNYDFSKASEYLDELAKGLNATIQSTQSDSPIFLMIPDLNPQNPENFVSIPQDFGEEVETARASCSYGKLALLAYEARNFSWELPAIRKIGKIQFHLNKFSHAKESWEIIEGNLKNDLEANEFLSTIYQRIADIEMPNNEILGNQLFAKSNLSIEKILQQSEYLDSAQLAETFALRARNAKKQWLNSWQGTNQKEINALTSSHLFTSFEHYAKGFKEDLNHYYSGLNALGLLTVIIQLAQKNSKTWTLLYSNTEEAVYELKKLKKEWNDLSTLVKYSIKAHGTKLEIAGKSDVWYNISIADLTCLTEKHPEKVRVLYRRALENGTEMGKQSAKNQLLIYEQLGVLEENTKAGLKEFGGSHEVIKQSSSHYFLFTGHMVDSPGRDKERFPQRIEKEVRKAILDVVRMEQLKITSKNIGIAGGACGGDIIFHEVCKELQIPTNMLLALPRDKFIPESVGFAGEFWIERFNNLFTSIPVDTLFEDNELPDWLRPKCDSYSIWERNNLWLLYSALVNGGENMTLIALWDEKKGDATGGTEHMVKEAKDRGADVRIINPNKFINN
jgi:hypothetical protein